jgi:hypothetical protein
MFVSALWFLDGSWAKFGEGDQDVASLGEGDEKNVEEKADQGDGKQGAGGAKVSDHAHLGMEWLARAAKGGHPLAIPLYSMLSLDEPLASAVQKDMDDAQAQTHQVDSFDPNDLQAYLSAGHFLDMNEETKLAAVAATNCSSPALPSQKALAAELLEPLSSAAASTQAWPGGEREVPSIADRLAALRSSFHTVLQVTEQQVETRLAAEMGAKIRGHGPRKKRNAERGFGGIGVTSLLAGKQMRTADQAKARGLLGIREAKGFD